MTTTVTRLPLPVSPAALLPEPWFTAAADPLLWIFVCASIPMLLFGADRLVDAAVRIARAAGMSTILIGATIVSLGTTTPEAVVSVRAAIGGEAGISLGNAVGSIICDTALIFGLCCTLTALRKDRFILNRHGWIQLGSGALLVAVALISWAVSGDMADVRIGRGVGLLLLGLLVGYMVLSVRWAREKPELVPQEAAVALSPNRLLRMVLASLLALLVGLTLVVLGSELLVGSAGEICRRNHVPEPVIAVTLVAFGTSLPELVTAIASVIKGHQELLVGNVIGADILNVLFVVGASATATPLAVEPVFFRLLLPVMMLVLILFRAFIFMPGDRFRRWQGIPLLIIYVLFVVFSVTVFGIGA
ncbi:MAG: calcium/sodium antiporter [Planctomycetes bacterium]|nr:calcium/sodium antiporter [Planctomycetota bacterium]